MIEAGVKETLQYEDNPYLKAFGMTISSEMLQVNARLLPAPNPVFANKGQARGDTGIESILFRRRVESPKPKINYCSSIGQLRRYLFCSSYSQRC